jgi:starch synthase
MNILHVAAEFFPILKTGGLADVLGALPKAQMLADSNTDVRILLPGFPAILREVSNCIQIAKTPTFAGDISLLLGSYHSMKIYVIKADHLYLREGSPYHNAKMEPYSDNYLRFGLLGWIASELACRSLDTNWKADVVHAHDWHAGLAAAYLAAKNRPALSVFTIHNLAYQGVFPAHQFPQLKLPNEFIQMHGLEFYGQISFLKAGIFYSDYVTTVSPTYAKEITEYDYAYGLHGLLNERHENQRLLGILNGVDHEIWNPLQDIATASAFSVDNIAGKKICKTQLQKDLGLPIDSKKILFGVVSRLTEQKGLDWVYHALPNIIQQGGQLALLGTGDAWLQDAFLVAAKKWPEHIAVHIGYSDALAHQFISGADVVLVPSRFEPCGLTQLYALKYGTVPLVRCTGGLADTIVDCSLENLNNQTATGFVFNGHDTDAFVVATERVFALWERPALWKLVQKSAMSQNFSWEIAANKYLQIYRDIY